MAEREKPVSQTELARLLGGVTTRTIRNWVADEKLPQRTQGGRPVYMLSEVLVWWGEKKAAEVRATEAPDLLIEQARKMRADADLSELKVSQLRGDLIAAAAVEKDMERLCAVLRARVLSVRGRWAPKVLGLGTMAEATTALDSLTADILDALRSGADDLEDEPEEEAA